MKKITFIGIGLMGLPMAKNLLKAGYSLKIYNRTLIKAEVLKKYNAEIKNSIKDAVIDSEVIITMLSDDGAVNAVMKNDEFLNNIKSGATIIDMSSVKPETARFHGTVFKQKNINYLDAPVSGGTIGAEAATLAIMVGGDEKIFNDHLNILKTMGKATLVGPLASGQVSKLANQIIVGLTIGAVAEAVILCERAGADPEKMIKALTGGWADSKILQTHGLRMVKNDFTPKGKNSTQLKDMNNILDCAKNSNLHLPISTLVKEMYNNLIKNGHADKDHSSLYEEIKTINEEIK
jgi:2-hydroxy-3-oxopropionate reductase